MPERGEVRVPEGGRVLLAFGGVVTVLLSATFFTCLGAFSLFNPALQVDVRCVQMLDYIFLRYWFFTVPCMLVIWGGLYMLVTAVVGRNRKLFNSGVAVVLMWLVVGVLFGWLLYH